MVKHLTNLDYKDKAYMIFNVCNFSLPTRSQINFYRSVWIDEVKTHLTEEELDTEEMRIHAIKESCKNFISKLGLTKLDKLQVELDRMFDSLVCACPFETKDDISNFFYYASRNLKGLNTFHYKEINDYEPYEIVFDKIFNAKIKAHEIWLKGNRNENQVIPYSIEYLRNAMHSVLYSTDPTVAAINWALIRKELEISPKKTNEVDAAISSMKKWQNQSFDIETFDRMVNKLVDEQIDLMDAIKSVPEDAEAPGFTELSMQNARHHVENYRKDKISYQADQFSCYGENVIPDSFSTMHEFVYCLKDVTESFIPKKFKNINFVITESDIGYLKSKLNVPLCKVMERDGTCYTLKGNKKYDEASVLFYAESGELYETSIAHIGNGHRICCIDVPKDVTYKLECGPLW